MPNRLVVNMKILLILMSDIQRYNKTYDNIDKYDVNIMIKVLPIETQFQNMNPKHGFATIIEIFFLVFLLH